MFALSIILFGMLIMSCDDDTITQQPTPTEKVTTSIFGTIIDESKDPVSGVAISIDGNVATTDNYGNFIMKDVSIPAENAFLTATKSGFFKGMRTFQPVKNSLNTVRITLLEKSLAGTVDAASGGAVTMVDGTKVELKSNGVMKSDGSTYTGTVNVYVKRLNPADDDILTQMPGDLTAENAAGEERMLETFGMLAVELQGASGEALNVKDGETAELTFPLDAAISSDAPATIPLWYFDETTGIWKEEGVATLVGDKYVGDVSHFSFWNCDAPFPIVKITGSVFNGNTPLVGVSVKVSRTNGDPDRPAGYGITDTSGVFCGKMPANEILLLEVFNQCGEVVASETIGPFTSDTDIGSFQADVSINTTTIVGTAVDCDGDPVSNAYIMVKDGGYSTSYPSLDGSFAIPIIYCSGTTEIEIRVIDADNQTESGWVTYPVSSPETNVGDVIACNGITEYVRYTINGTDEYLIYSDVSAGTDGPSYMYLNATNSTVQGPEYFYLNLYNQTTEVGVGTYTIEGQQQTSEGYINFYVGNDSSTTSYTNIVIEFTEYGDADEVIEGTVNGYVKTYEDDSFNIDGSFNVIREF